MRQVAKEIPAGDFRRLVEMMMESVWGGMTDVRQQRLGALIGELALRDQQGALAWARGSARPDPAPYHSRRSVMWMISAGAFTRSGNQFPVPLLTTNARPAFR